MSAPAAWLMWSALMSLSLRLCVKIRHHLLCFLSQFYLRYILLCIIVSTT